MRKINLNIGRNGHSDASASSISLHGNQQKSYDSALRIFKKYDFGSALQGLTESFVSCVLDFITYNGMSIPHVEYFVFKEEDVRGTFCHSFLQKGEREVPLSRIIEFGTIQAGTALNEITVDECITIISDICRKFTGLSKVTEYFAVLFLLDYIFLNEDRHLNNISFIRNVQGQYKFAPYFDFAESYRFLNPDNPERSFLTFEPLPFAHEQLDLLDRVLNPGDVVFNYRDWLDTLDRYKQAWVSVYDYDEISLLELRFLSVLESFPRKDLFKVVC